MTTINKSALIEFPPEKMYALVDDIPSYPEFLPWCRSSKELSRNEQVVEASLEIAHSGLHKSFTTRNTLEQGRSIRMELIEGPFKHLEGIWHFEPLGDTGCKVSLDMHFEFSSKLLSMTFGPLFGKIASSLVDAFIQRAKAVYE